jgi:predicted NUDIX family phosphoesterase
MWKEEMILVMPDLFEAEERVILTGMGFESHFTTRGSDWQRPADLVRSMRREDAERVPNPYKLKIRQLVANVMVFVLPDDLYAALCAPHAVTTQNEFHLVNRITTEAILYASLKTKQSSESRLHGKLAAGFGGHVDVQDSARHLDTLIRNAAIRELKEELESSMTDKNTFSMIVDEAIIPLGIINSSASEVESVHIGFINIVAFPKSVGLKIAETDILQKVHIDLHDFKELATANKSNHFFEYDHWTQLLFAIPRNLYAGLIMRSAAAISANTKAPK